ncbi:MAG: hypothetical protein A2847_00705 [Candidatus Sungbacteria bacterium RIFCSPHIGHO2_01_FULL_50_25]|uniref:Type II secretion system protein GspF domain-containing protein n=1 Tax=Candidatus Sungbacteria bacterium RIFCSPHIGHO2_01_FULL_50_25 TaxID=1802265 RepID=A0A1G2KF25_9BACT|nr:MAG: hypothetical protein A2847_00705 [Candidatus Sungbacteria bacterium RIFCSPHIGHO2_01_FULL_50_25]
MNKVRTFFLGRLSLKEQTLFAKRLSFLITGGIPILEGLTLLSRQAKTRTKKKIFEKIIFDVANGQFLSTSLAQFNNMFGDFAINLIRVGETSGVLSQNLNYLADELKKKQILRQKVLSALVYPAFITVMTFAVAILLTAYIFPKIMPIFQSLHVTLPITTRILIWMSDAIRSYGFYAAGVLLAAGIAFAVCVKKIELFHYAVDRTLIRLPIVGRLIQSYNMANFTRTLGLLLKSGISILHATKIAADTLTNRAYRKEARTVEHVVLKGGKISKHLEKSPRLFPDMATQMILIGETSGKLPETLVYLSEMYEHDVEDITKNLSSSIEPILMVVMGLIVGFVAISVITPIYDITQNLSNSIR